MKEKHTNPTGPYSIHIAMGYILVAKKIPFEPRENSQKLMALNIVNF